MLKCDDIRELSPAYQDGDLPSGIRLGFLLHILLCRACRIYMRQIRSLRALLTGLPPAPPPGPARSRSLEGFRNPLA
jgi:hypothetical protein